MDTIPSEQRARLTARLPMSAHERLHEAASLRGTTVNAFVIQAALKEAEEVIERDRVIRLTEESARRIVDLLDKPPAPNAHLKGAVAAYRDRVRDDT